MTCRELQIEIDLIGEARTEALKMVSHPGNASWAVGYPCICVDGGAG